jgi:hypothetical protein
MALTAGYRNGFHNIVDQVFEGLLTAERMSAADAQRELVTMLRAQGATEFESRREAQLAVERRYRRRSA